jgi:pimeloyl-ACP methyl ester carboxylesterase
MLDWPIVEPAGFRRPTLWLVGAEDPHAMASLEGVMPRLPGSQVQVQVMAGLGHEQVFDEIEAVFPTLQAFGQAAATR